MWRCGPNYQHRTQKMDLESGSQSSSSASESSPQKVDGTCMVRVIEIFRILLCCAGYAWAYHYYSQKHFVTAVRWLQVALSHAPLRHSGRGGNLVLWGSRSFEGLPSRLWLLCWTQSVSNAEYPVVCHQPCHKLCNFLRLLWSSASTNCHGGPPASFLHAVSNEPHLWGSGSWQLPLAEHQPAHSLTPPACRSTSDLEQGF